MFAILGENNSANRFVLPDVFFEDYKSSLNNSLMLIGDLYDEQQKNKINKLVNTQLQNTKVKTYNDDDFLESEASVYEKGSGINSPNSSNFHSKYSPIENEVDYAFVKEESSCGRKVPQSQGHKFMNGSDKIK